MQRAIQSFSDHDRKQWLILGFAVIGLTSTVTLLTFYLPLILNTVTHSRLAIGAALGMEGVAALAVPLLVGQASDRTWNRYGRRLPYLLAGTPLVVAGMILVAYLHTYVLILAGITVYFIGYYTYYTAYQALYPDTLPASQYGRAWAYQSLFQGAGAGLALLGGGALARTDDLGIPFLVAGGIFLAVAVLTYHFVSESRDRAAPDNPSRLHQVLPNFFRRVRDDRNLRLFLPAHFCWEFTLAAIRTFVMLYLLQGLGLRTGQLLPLLVVIVAVYLIASVVSGQIADRYDPRQYTAWVITLYAASMLATGLITNLEILRALVPFGMFAGAAVLMLSYPILLRVTPARRHGEYTGYYQFNRGLALIIGSSLTGFLIDAFGRFFSATHGYQVLWLTAAAFCFLSLPFFLKLTGTRASDSQQTSAAGVKQA